MIDLRFATALQMVLSVALADRNGLRCTSRILAEGLATNPSFIRKLLVPLSRAGMIVTTIGKGGGLHLGRPAGEITLREIYQTVTAEKRFLSSRQYIPCICPVSANMNEFFTGIVDDIKGTVYSILETTTVDDSLARILELNREKNSRAVELEDTNSQPAEMPAQNPC